MKQAKHPFEFVAATYLTQICSERAWTLAELAQNLTKVSDACIFNHTFQSLESHHYPSFSNDFAQWVIAACLRLSISTWDKGTQSWMPLRWSRCPISLPSLE